MTTTICLYGSRIPTRIREYPAITERDRLVYEAKIGGKTLNQIGRLFGISAQRVGQIFARVREIDGMERLTGQRLPAESPLSALPLSEATIRDLTQWFGIRTLADLDREWPDPLRLRGFTVFSSSVLRVRAVLDLLDYGERQD
ncbi:MAG TPA: hypothetical protein VD994_17060 [Prosthecobacter sp.]|nr:hypothetical protein [Prosthecobacter sp.]